MSEIACFSELEAVKSKLLEDQVARKTDESALKWEKVWAVLYNSTEGWRLSVWTRKEQWKNEAAPLATLLLSTIQVFVNTEVGRKKNILKVKFDSKREWMFCCLSDAMLAKWTNTIKEKLALSMKYKITQKQKPGVAPQWNHLAGWEGGFDDDKPLEELRLLLLKCSSDSNLSGPHIIITHPEYLYVMKVEATLRWWWSWSEIKWYCLDIGNSGKKLILKSKSPHSHSYGVFTWSGSSVARFFAVLTEHIPSKKIEKFDKERGVSIAEDTLTTEQLNALMREKYLVKLYYSEAESHSGSYWIVFTDTSIRVLFLESGEDKMVLRFMDIEEFTLNEANDHNVLSIVVNRGENSGVYELRGEKISLVFLIMKELTGRMAAEMERKGHEQVTEEFGEGICINVSARVLELMKLTYSLRLLESPSHPNYIGDYEVTLTRDTILLTSLSSSTHSWNWKLEHIRRLHLERKANKSVLMIEAGRRSCTGEGLFVFDGEERELSNLCLVFREVINRLMLVVKIQHTLVRIKVKLVVRLRTARPGELIEAVPVTLMNGNTADHFPGNQHALHIYPTELKLLNSFGTCVNVWPLKSLGRVSMETAPESNTPYLVLTSSDSSSITTRVAFSSKDPIVTYSVLLVTQEQFKTTLKMEDKLRGHVVRKVKNAHGYSICDDLCSIVLEDECIKLIRMSNGKGVWLLELPHLKSITIEDYPDGLGVLMVQTSRKSPYGGQHYHLLCQEPERVFNDILSYAEKYKGQVIIHEHEMIGAEEDYCLMQSQLHQTLQDHSSGAVPTHLTKPSVGAGPTHLTGPSVGTDPTHLTDSKVGAGPTHFTDSSVGTDPTHLTDSRVKAGPTHLTDSSLGASPNHLTDSSLGASPTHLVDLNVGAGPTHLMDSSLGASPNHLTDSRVGAGPTHPELSAGMVPAHTKEFDNETPTHLLDLTTGTVSTHLLDPCVGSSPTYLLEFSEGKILTHFQTRSEGAPPTHIPDQLAVEDHHQFDVLDDMLVEDSTGETMEEMRYRFSKCLNGFANGPEDDVWMLPGVTDEEDDEGSFEDISTTSTEEIGSSKEESVQDETALVPSIECVPAAKDAEQLHVLVPQDSLHLGVKCADSTASLDTDISDDVFDLDTSMPTQCTPSTGILESSEPFVNLARFRENSKNLFISPSVFTFFPPSEDHQHFLNKEQADMCDDIDSCPLLTTAVEEASPYLEVGRRCGYRDCHMTECETHKVSLTFSESDYVSLKVSKPSRRRFFIKPTFSEVAPLASGATSGRSVHGLSGLEDAKSKGGCKDLNIASQINGDECLVTGDYFSNRCLTSDILTTGNKLTGERFTDSEGQGGDKDHTSCERSSEFSTHGLSHLDYTKFQVFGYDESVLGDYRLSTNGSVSGDEGLLTGKRSPHAASRGHANDRANSTSLGGSSSLNSERCLITSSPLVDGGGLTSSPLVDGGGLTSSPLVDGGGLANANSLASEQRVADVRNLADDKDRVDFGPTDRFTGEDCLEFKLNAVDIDSVLIDVYTFVNTTSIVCKHYILVHDGESLNRRTPIKAHPTAEYSVEDGANYCKHSEATTEAWGDKDGDASVEEDQQEKKCFCTSGCTLCVSSQNKELVPQVTVSSLTGSWGNKDGETSLEMDQEEKKSFNTSNCGLCVCEDSVEMIPQVVLMSPRDVNILLRSPPKSKKHVPKKTLTFTRSCGYRNCCNAECETQEVSITFYRNGSAYVCLQDDFSQWPQDEDYSIVLKKGGQIQVFTASRMEFLHTVSV